MQHRWIYQCETTVPTQLSSRARSCAIMLISNKIQNRVNKYG